MYLAYGHLSRECREQGSPGCGTGWPATGIANLGQPCRKHHRLKHNSAWTPARASKDTPPGWTSPTGRYYPSEQQDWEPPHCPPGILDTYPAPNADAEDPSFYEPLDGSILDHFLLHYA